MNDSIINLLNLKGDDITLTGYDTSDDNEIIVNVQKAHRLTNCPLCGSVFYSKGSDIRKLNHPILQDNRHITIHLKKMKYKCSNPDCGYFTVTPSTLHQKENIQLRSFLFLFLRSSRILIQQLQM